MCYREPAGEEPMMIVALIPAHNEEDCISQTLTALFKQDLMPDRVIVIADNCSDRTAEIASAFSSSVTVYQTVGNTHKKAGALNQVLEEILPGMRDDDLILVQDADSCLSPSFLAIASCTLADPNVGAVGGVFYGRRGAGRWLIESMQRTEYVRYARQIARNGSHAYVLTGTATLFTVKVLREVALGRKDGRLPPGPGEYYDEHTMTEDSYMTFAVKSLG